MRRGGFLDSLGMAWTRWTGRTVSSFCRLETALDERTLVARDGSLLTLVAAHGSLRVLGAAERSELMEGLLDVLNTFLDRPGHAFHWGYLYDPERLPPEVERFMAAQKQAARRGGLQVEDILESQREALLRWLGFERSVIALWTRPSAVAADILKEGEAEIAAEAARMPRAIDAQWLYTGAEAVLQAHQSYVDAVVAALRDNAYSAETLDVRAAARVIRGWAVREAESESWQPALPGDGVRPRDLGMARKDDVSGLLWPKLGDQILSVDAWSSDHTSARIGAHDYAYLNMTLAPEKLHAFRELMIRMHELNVPWRVVMMLDHMGQRMPLKNLLSAITAWSSGASARVRRALQAVNADQQDGRRYAVVRVSFCTWADAGDRKQLNRRVSRLRDALGNWGQLQAQADAGDGLSGVMSSAIGMGCASTATPTLAPLDEIVHILPFDRTTSSWRSGTMAFVTALGQLALYQPGSNVQERTNTIIFAPPGSGKSLLMNKINLATCLAPTAARQSARLPRIAMIDIGPSAKGLIDLLQSALPPERRHEAIYIRLRSTAEHAVNILDTMLGQRYPSPIERDFIINVLELLCTPDGRERPYEGVGSVLAHAVTRAYENMATDQQKPYAPGADALVDRAISAHGIRIDEHTTWWDVVDALFRAGCVREAGRAQRFAVPTLTDVVAALSDPRVRDNFSELRVQETGEQVVQAVVRYIGDAQQRYPMLGRPTAWDLANARVIAVDLEEVVGSAMGASSQATLMYMIARHLAARDFYFSADEAKGCSPLYRDYHVARVRQDREMPKRICIDELHKARKTASFMRQIEEDMRLGRKYGVQVCLASQQLDDFSEGMRKTMSDLLILGVGDNEELEQMAEVFGRDLVTETARRVIKRALTGPGPRGAPLFAIFKTKMGVNALHVRHVAGAVEVWGLSTHPRDIPLRERLYERLGPQAARRLLAERFPGGSAASLIEQRIEALAASGAVEEEQAANVYDELVEELLASMHEAA